VLARFGHLESIPESARDWHVNASRADTLAATLVKQHDLALLFRTLATLRTDAPTFDSVDELEWRGPRPEFEALAARFEAAARNTAATAPRRPRSK